MAKNENKTQPTTADAYAYIAALEAESQRQDCTKLLELMQAHTGCPPVMWGAKLVGFGRYHYKYASGRSGDWFVMGFSARKQNISLHLYTGLEVDEALWARLGKHKRGVGCLYLKRLDDADPAVLREILAACVSAVPTMPQ